jgi:hypothetical protein
MRTPRGGGSNNVLPTVANCRVYVVSYGRVTVFGFDPVR